MRLLFLPKYSADGPSSRHRFFAVAEYLRDEGHEVEVRPLFHQGYVTRFFRTGSRLSAAIVLDYWRRIALLRRGLGGADMAVIEYEALPYCPLALEVRLLRRLRPWVLDVDDAVEVRYRGLPRLHSKIDRLFAEADGIVAGNSVLAAELSDLNPRVACVPTGVRSGRYQPKGAGEYPVRGRPVVIGWMGSPTSFKYLDMVSAPMAELAARHSLVLRVVGPRQLSGFGGVRVECVPWAEAEESSRLRNFDIGVMPLTDDAFARGKSGFKLIQYMAAGLPCVASDVGCNAQILDYGEAGLLASSAGDWVASLERLIVDQTARASLGAAARRRFLGEYTLEHLSKRRLDFYSALLNDGRTTEALR